MTQVQVEQTDLSDGTAIVYKDYGNLVRMAYDPRQVTEAKAMALLRSRHPRLQGLVPVLQATA